MNVASIFSTKGGSGKTTLVFLLAAAIKKLVPTARVGIIDATSDQGALSGEWAFEKEEDADGLGLWRMIHTLIDPMASRKAATLMAEILPKSVTTIRVIPGVPAEEGSIELINTCRDFGKLLRDYPQVTSRSAAQDVGVPILTEVADQLGWDWCLLDLPGSIQDSLSKMLLPNCTTVIVPHDLRSDMNFHGFPDLMATLEALSVPVSGFLVNQREDSMAFRDAYGLLESMIADPEDACFEKPIVGEVDTFLTIRKSLKRVPDEERTGPDDAEAGLYRMLEAKRLFGSTLNDATRAAVQKAITQIEGTAQQIINTCAVPVAEEA